MQIIKRKEAKDKGLPQYFTGKPCINGHFEMRNTKSGKCLQCDRDRNAKYREENPHVMEQWRANNPTYASDKYHEQREGRQLQQKQYYQNNADKIKQDSKRWREANPEQRAENTRRWYAANPEYDKQYYYANHEHMVQNIKPAQRKRYYAKRRKQIQKAFRELAVASTLPPNPTERDFKYWLAGVIIEATGWEVEKEVFLDEARTSRIDLLIPEQQIGIELKINNMYGNTNKSYDQVQRYQELLPDYDILLVSVDGSIGISPLVLFEQLDDV